jgi:ABC-type glycerol-3-phosphate transport system substrate-binding protein
MRKSKLLIAAPILSAVLLLAGCGSDSEDTDSGAATAAATEEATEEATEDAAEVNTDKVMQLWRQPRQLLMLLN